MIYTAADFRLLTNLVRLMIKDRFLGSGLGLIWAIANPIMMLSIFTFVFGFVFKSRLPGAETSLSYVIWLMSGYGPWFAISEGVTISTASVTTNTGLVKNLRFKSELLPIAGAISGLIPFFITFLYVLVLLIIEGQRPTISWFVVLPIVLVQISIVIGLGLLLAALNVFVRDVGIILPNILTIIMFGSPIFYPISALPSVLQRVAEFNPFYVLTQWYRLPLIEGRLPSFWSLIYVLLFAALCIVVGLVVFRRLKPYFASRL